MNTQQVLYKLKEILADSEQVAREIYYAMSQIPDNNTGMANLKIALRLLGVNEPKDVGLSNSVLVKKL